MTTHPRRRWFRFAFSLRTLFVFVTLAGVLSYPRVVWDSRQEAFAVAELERLGCYVDVVDFADAPAWHQVFNVDAQHAWQIRFPHWGNSAPLPVASFAHLKYCRHLERLDLIDQVNVTDKTLREIAKLPRMKYLLLAGTSVTDAGLAFLERSPSLKMVYIGETKVTDDGIRKLKAAIPAIHVYRRI